MSYFRQDTRLTSTLVVTLLEVYPLRTDYASQWSADTLWNHLRTNYS